MTLKERIDALFDKNGAVQRVFPAISNAAKWYADLPQLSDEMIDMFLTSVELADATLKKEFQDTEYIRLRQAVYPPLQDQLDTIFHSGIEGWQAQIQAIKDLYPKPGV